MKRTKNAMSQTRGKHVLSLVESRKFHISQSIHCFSFVWTVALCPRQLLYMAFRCVASIL